MLKKDGKKQARLPRRISSFTPTKSPSGEDKEQLSARGTGVKSNRSAENEVEKKAAGNKGTRVQYDKEAEARFDVMLTGCLDNLPRLPRSIVRIFLSSTFSDTRAERNALAKTAYPRLRAYCAEKGLEFQVADLRWGVHENSQNDHSAEDICLQEIANCQQLSLGPNFVGFLSHRYGGCHPPPRVEVKEMEVLKAEIQALALPHAALLDTWYILDTNAVPPVYLLQPVRSQLTFYADFSPGCEELRKRDTQAWLSTCTNLLAILRQAADSALKKGNFTPATRRKYFRSVTEQEVEMGILQAKKPRDHSLLYQRNIRGLEGSALTEDKAQRFVETTSADGKLVVDLMVQKLRRELQGRAEEALQGSANRRVYTVPWVAGGIDPSNHDHAQYLSEFCAVFINDVISLVDRGRHETENLIRTREYYSDYNETLHHLHFCKLKCKTFCGQEDILQQVRSYLSQSSAHPPLVIHAESGAGKTSVMAMVMSRLKKWIKGDYSAAIRFLGTSQLTQDIYQTLFSVCGQIADTGNVILEPIAYKNMKSLVNSLPRILRSLASSLKQPIVILLDSLDQLGPSYNAYSAAWLPAMLPPNVHVVVSTLTREYGILDNLKKKLPADSFLEVPALPQDTGREIVQTCLKAKSRVLTEEQMDHVLKTFAEVPNPLYLKILVDEAAKWASYLPLDACKLATSAKGAIEALFSRLEDKFGRLLVARALGYLTVGLNGLTEAELEDALSCDDEVLGEVYRYHDPPIPGTVRIPPVLWARIRYDIYEYLVERLSQGKTTLYWYHRQFIEVATQRYASGDVGVDLHRKLFMLFEPEDGVRREITLAMRKMTIPDADRQVAEQPLNARNTRKLQCMTYHSQKAALVLGAEVIKRKLYCNMRYLGAMITAFSVDALLKAISSFLDVVPEDEEVLEVKRFLEISHGNLKNPLVFAGLLLAYLKAGPEHLCLESLRKEARALLEAAKQPLLIPEFPCLAPTVSESATDERELTDISELLASGEGWLLLRRHSEPKSEEDQEATVKPFCLYNKASQELSTLDIDQGALVGRPKVSRDSETCLMASASSLQLLKPSDGSVEEKSVDAVMEVAGGSNKVVAFTLSADATHCALATAERKIVLCSVKGLKKVAEFEPTSPLSKADICSMVCTSGSSPTIVTAGIRTSKTERMGVLSQWRQGSSKAKSTKEVATLNPDILGLSEDEQQFLCACNKGESGKVVMYQISSMDSLISLEMGGKVTNLLVSQTQPYAVVLVGQKEVKVIDLNAKAVTSSISHAQPIVDLSLSIEEDVVVVADEKGVTVYSWQDGATTVTLESPSPVAGVALMQEYLATVDAEHKVMLRSLEDVKSGRAALASSEAKAVGGSGDPLNDTTLLSFCLSHSSQEVITGCADGTLRVFSVCRSLLKTMDIGIKPDFLYTAAGQLVVAHEKAAGKLKVVDLTAGEKPMPVAGHVMSVALTSDGLEMVALARENNALSLHQVELNTGICKKRIALPSLSFIDIDICLVPSERYVVLSVLLPKEEREAIMTSWKKHSGFSAQEHPYRLVAVDLQNAKGNYLLCLRSLTKISHLVEVVVPFRGNTVVFSMKRLSLFWDIPTGKAHQWMSKVKKQVMIYRPDWCGENCVGINTCYAQAKGHDFLAVGSQDGYLIVYGAESGLPRGLTAPSTRHRAEVTGVAATPDGKTVASVCKNGILKLWSSAKGTELFSTNLRLEIKAMSFTPDSSHLVLLSVATPKSPSRLLIFKLHEAKA